MQELREFKEQHGAIPERIIFYRDRSGEEDEQLHKAEVEVLKNKLNEIYIKFGTGEPKFINGKFSKQKALPLTLFVHSYKFFLVQQSVRDGTEAPISYNVIYDQRGLMPEEMQMLTSNWRCHTPVPSIVRYARKPELEGSRNNI